MWTVLSQGITNQEGLIELTKIPKIPISNWEVERTIVHTDHTKEEM